MSRQFCFVLMMVLPLGVWGAALPDRLETDYTLRSGNLKLGSLTRALWRKGEGYRFVARTKPSGLGKILTDGELREEGEFNVIDGVVRPAYYRQERSGEKSYVRHVEFDWAASLLRFADGRQEPLPANTQDAGSIAYALMLSPPVSGSPHEVHVTNGKRLKKYTYQRVDEERITTPLGEFDTVRIVRENPRRKETVTLWYAPAKGNLTLKIRKEREGRPTTTLMIDRLAGL